MLKTLKATFPRDPDLPDRTTELIWRGHVLRGRLYDMLPHAFHTEKNEAGEYIPIRDRRPSVRYKLCPLVVDDSVSLLFSEGHFPELEHEDKPTKEALQRICKELALNMVMIDAATRGSVGSVAIFMSILEGRVFLDVMDTAYLTPTWRMTAPDTLELVTERYKVKGKVLREMGYLADKDNEDYWFQRDWTPTEEITYFPLLVSKAREGYPPQVDPGGIVRHGLGFVPIVWVKNLPGGDHVDGLSTFPDEAIETSIEIDYQLSQAGRGLKYSSDPTLLIKEPANGEGKLIKGGGNAIVVDKDGDAKMLEINGSAANAVIEYVRFLRELALESMHGNRSNADKLSAAQSGRALELMHQALIWLADRLRISYGEGALLSVLSMILRASDKLGGLLYRDGTKMPRLDTSKPLSLRWPAWFTPTTQDMLDTASTLKILVSGGMLSRETAIKVLAAQYDIEDAKAEKVLIEAEMKVSSEGAQKTEIKPPAE